MAVYEYEYPLDFSLAEQLPVVELEYPLDTSVAAGALLMQSWGGRIVQQRVFIRTNGVFIDADADGPSTLVLQAFDSTTWIVGTPDDDPPDTPWGVGYIAQ